MEIVARVNSLGTAGPNVWIGLEYATNTGLSGGGEATVDPSASVALIVAAIAEGARAAIRATGETVAIDAPVTIVGGVVKV